MDENMKVFESIDELVAGFSDFFFKKAKQRIEENKTFTVALSGGTTPKMLFQHLAKNHNEATEWNHIHFFWGDERMVPAESKESNFGVAKELFFDRIVINEENIHPIRGDNDPENEAARYSCEIVSYVHEDGALPSFDLIILGVGEDGHTGSIFPNQLDLMYSDRVCETAEHPVTGQQRITLSGKTINNARNVAFLAVGSQKATIINDIVNKQRDYEKYPAAHVKPDSGRLYWFLDHEAAHHLST
jgi:6-phosphogluconolactonase